MSWHRLYQLVKSDYLKLVLILGFAFFIAFIPHQGYAYPVHLDEWVHMACSEQMIDEAAALGLANPFSGGEALSTQSLEFGFDLYWATFQQVTGLSWLVIFKYFPAIIFMMTVLSVYILGRRHGFGWEAALGTCFILTTTRFLGPGFLVPVALGLLFIPLGLFLAFHLRHWGCYVLIFLFTIFLISSHAATAIGLVIVLAPFIVLNFRKDFRHSLGLALALIVPFLAPFPWIYPLFLPTAKAFLTVQPPPVAGLPYITQIPYLYGFLPTFLFVAGIFMLARRGKLTDYSLVIAPLLFLLLIGLFANLNRGVDVIYARSHLYLMMMMGIVGGYGLMKIRSIRLPERFKPAFLSRNAGNFLCLALLIPTIFLSVRAHLNTTYYQMIDSYDYEAFVWIKENVGDEYDKAILDPWQATAFTAITGKKVYSNIMSQMSEKDERAYQFIKEYCSDTDFLIENDISIVYTRYKFDNPDLVELREDVYLLPEAEAE